MSRFNVKSPALGMIFSIPKKENSSKGHLGRGFGTILDSSVQTSFLAVSLGLLSSLYGKALLAAEFLRFP